MSLPRVTPPGAGLDSDVVLRLVENLGKLDCHSFMVVRHQVVVAECWWAPYSQNYRHALFSLTKSFTSVAIGFAVEEGLLSIQDPVLKFFPELLPCEPCGYMTKMTVKDLLTMSTGHTKEPTRWGGAGTTPGDRRPNDDHVYHFLSSFVDKEPGSYFMYNTPATFMCGAILHSLTGQHVFDFLKPRLLDPLGISDYYCEVNKRGLTPAGTGGHLRTEDIAKFGLFLLNRGSWNGKQLLPASWLDEATTPQVDNSNHPSGHREWTSGYGYQFWNCSPPGAYRGDGLYGQFCIVMPEQNAVVAITSGSSQMGSILDTLWDLLLPELKKKSPDVQPAPETLARLTKLQIHPPLGKSRAEPSTYSGRVYELAPNVLQLTRLSVRDAVGEATVTFWRGEKNCTAGVGYGKWVDTITGPDDDGIANIFSQIACAGAWEGDVFHLKIVYTKTPFSDVFAISFDDKGIVIDYTRDHANDQTRLIGREV